MAESSFAFDLADDVLRKLVSLYNQHMILGRYLEREVDKLMDSLMHIKAVLLDAEMKQVENRDLSNWVRKIKDVCYDVDDVFDEFQCEAIRWQLANNDGIKGKVCKFFSHSNPLTFRLKMGRVIKEIRLKLDEIEAETVKFDLTVQLRDEQIIYSAMDTHFCNFFSHSNPLAFHFKQVKSNRKKQVEDGRIVHRARDVYSYVESSDVIGRDDDKERIIQLLQETIDYENVLVISIVGFGGLGKTTLAKLVYNDEWVAGHFDLRMWVCVPEGFDVKNLIKKIIYSAGRIDCGDLTFNQMQTILRDALFAKRFLLVLDNVWNVDLKKWVELKHLLMIAANGSKIIATTRSKSVASIMSFVPEHIHMLRYLSHKDCMSLFAKWTFRKGEETLYPNLMEIGEEIVKRCGGVPLAVRTLGGLLHSKIDDRDWLVVKNNEIWKFERKENDILPALRLSYATMPAYLKKCFAFCSIFPKDYEFNNFEVIQLWLAQGFLPLSSDNQEWEDIGQRYFNELWSRSFFHSFEGLGGSTVFKMHDLVHDLALSLAEGEWSTVSFQTCNISNRLRHVSFFEDESFGQEVASTLSVQQSKNIRTILCRGECTSDSLMETCISRFNELRVLDLGDSQIEMLPNSLGKLKRLRYLNLSRNSRIKKLPNSICKLVNLQTLNLAGCEELAELPRDIGNLIRLTCLWLTIKLTVLPEKGIGCLTSLRILWIGKCGNLKYLSEGLIGLTALENLAIGDCEKLNLMEPEGDNIQGLRLGRLRSLRLVDLPELVGLPPWLHGAANTLRSIHIEYCVRFMELPEWLQDLTSLQKLEMEDCPRLSALPEGMHHLTALRELKIKRCPELTRRCKRETGKDWPKIAHIQQINLDEVNSEEDDNSVSSSDEVP